MMVERRLSLPEVSCWVLHQRRTRELQTAAGCLAFESFKGFACMRSLFGEREG